MSLELPGFAEPVADAQRTFRAVLDAIAHPGRLHLVGDNVQPPAPLECATAAVLLALVDADTPLWLGPQFSEARDWIAFHCGAPITDDPARAAFAVTVGLPDLTQFPAGSDEAPEASATLIAQIAGSSGAQRLRLAGPGLRTPVRLDIAGLPAEFAAMWAANHALYPRGIDLLLVAGARITALPRSVSVDAG